MGEENIFSTAVSGAGEGPEETNTPDSAGTPDTGNGGAADGNGEEGKAKHGHSDYGGIEYTQQFKSRVDRIKRNERRRFDEELKKRDEEWNRKFEDFKKGLDGSGARKELKREDFSSDEEFANARREAAIEQIAEALDKRNLSRQQQDEVARKKQEAIDAANRKFAQKFQEGMNRTLSADQQKEVLSIINDEASAINGFLEGAEGRTLQGWLYEDCAIPADVILYLEKNSDKLDILGKLSPRRQLEQLDILERHLANAARKARDKAKPVNQNGSNEIADGVRKPPVMGEFGGYGAAPLDESKMSDKERVDRLIKVMRRR